LEFPDLKKKAIELYEKEKPEQVWIEDKASGISLIQELRRNTAIPIKEIKADKDKVEYVNACAPLIETGRVRLPFSADWLEDFIDEVVEFPNGEFDDQVDIMSKFLNVVKEKSSSKEIKIKFPKDKRIHKNKYRGYRR
ncbi:MAG: phage terminase large subunit, partial [Ignavibacteriaceae bacterium]